MTTRDQQPEDSAIARIQARIMAENAPAWADMAEAVDGDETWKYDQ